MRPYQNFAIRTAQVPSVGWLATSLWVQRRLAQHHLELLPAVTSYWYCIAAA